MNVQTHESEPANKPLDGALQEILAHSKRRLERIPPDLYSLMRMPNLFIFTQRMRAIVKLLRREGFVSLEGRRILEVGCGAGDWLLYVVLCGATPEFLSGIDLDESEIARALVKLPRADLRTGDAAHLPWPDKNFDIVMQMTAFSTMLQPRLRRSVAREMVRVVKPDGMILWYDLRVDNPWNPGIRPVTPREIKRLFPGCSLRLRTVTLLPPLTRRIVPLSWTAALFLDKIPLLRTHILGCIRPRQSGRPSSRSRRSPKKALSRGTT